MFGRGFFANFAERQLLKGLNRMINMKKSTFLYIFFAMMACSVPVKAQNPATQTITLSDGARYTGQVLRGKPNGKG